MRARILVIDDEAEIRRSVRMILEYDGYDVLEASSGPEGVALAEKEAPDLVFLDVKMPGMDGLEALQRIRAVNETLPVVIISGHGTVSTAVEATKAGAFDFIDKPLASERVLLTIRNALDQTRLADENRSLKRAVEVRHQMVGESPALRQRHPFGAARRFDDFVPLVLEDHPDRPADLRLVVDHQNPCLHRVSTVARTNTRCPTDGSYP